MSAVGRAALAAILGAVVARPLQAAPLALDPIERQARAYGFNPAVKPADYPDAAFVVLLDRLEKTIDARDSLTLSYHRAIKLLQGRARDRAKVRFVLPTRDNLQVVARTITPAGEVAWLAASDIHYEPVRSADPLDRGDGVVISFAFPAAEPGAILEYAYSVTLRDALDADVHLFDGPEPVQVAHYVLGHPARETYRVYAQDAFSRKPVTATSVAAIDSVGQPIQVDRYEVRDQPAIPRENLAIDELSLRSHVMVVRVLASTVAEESDPWKRLAGRLLSSQEGFKYSLDSQRLQALKAARRGDTAAARAQAVLAYLRGKLRIELQRAVSIHGRSIEEIFASGIAEPTEFCLFLTALLRQADLPAYLGFVNGAEQIKLDRRIPWGGFFDRLVVMVPVDGTALYFDPLSPDLSLGIPRADCQGRTMLIARNTGGVKLSDVPLAQLEARFVEIPRTRPEANAIERRVRLRLDPGGRTSVDYDETRSGEAAWEIADLLREAGVDDVRRTLAGPLLDALADADPESFTVTSTARAATLRGSVSTAALGLRSPQGIGLDVALFSRNPELAALATPKASTRRQGIDLGYPRLLRTEVVVELPPGARLESLPTPATIAGPGLRYTLAVRRTKAGLERTSTLLVNEAQIPRAELPAFESFLGQVLSAEAQTLLVTGLD